MRLTRRGWVVVALVALCTAMAHAYGARALNAVVAPSVVALVGGAGLVLLRDAPTVERRVPDAGAEGDVLTVELDVETSAPIGARLDDALEAWLATDDLPARTTIGDGPFRYDLRLRRRGEYAIGPLEVEITDALGLVARTFRYETTDEILVYPAAYRLDPPADGPGVFPDSHRRFRARDEFDGLREYERGDSLRDVHWKSTARRPDGDLLVQQYATDRRDEGVTIAVETASAGGVAEATASVALYLLDRQFSVGLVTPDGSVSPGTGETHRRAVLEALARLGEGQSSDEDVRQADLVVRAAGGDVVVVGEDVVPFDSLVARRDGERVRYRTPIGGRTSGPTASGPQEVSP